MSSSLQLFNELPQDIINIILEYHGYYKNRKGKLYTQIVDNDPRRLFLLEYLPIIRVYHQDELMRYYGVTFYVKTNDERKKYSIYITVLDTAFIWNMEVLFYDFTPNYRVNIKKTLEKSCTYRQY